MSVVQLHSFRDFHIKIYATQKLSLEKRRLGGFGNYLGEWRPHIAALVLQDSPMTISEWTTSGRGAHQICSASCRKLDRFLHMVNVITVPVLWTMR
jgi:hypothetical protein